MLYAAMKDNTPTSGKTSLIKLLKSGKELKVFSVKKENFAKFASQAKNYGVVYSALINKKDKANDGIIDIMVKAEDASKINRIVERFKLADYNETTIRNEIEKTKSKQLNPNSAKTVKSPQLEPNLKKNNYSQEGIKESVRKKLKENEKIIKAKSRKTKTKVTHRIKVPKVR